MPNSTTRRAQRSFTILATSILIVGLNGVASPSIGIAQPATNSTVAAPSGPPHQITASFSDQDNFVARLQRHGVYAAEAQSIDQAIRASLTPAQRRAGALIQISFGGDTWPMTVQTLSIEPVEGVIRNLDRTAIFLHAPATTNTAASPAVAPVTTAAVAPAATQAAAPTAAPAVAPAATAAPTVTPTATQAATPVAAPAVAPAATPVAAVPPPAAKPADAPKPADTAPLVKNVSLTATSLPSGKEISDPFGDVASTKMLAPSAGVIDPEWPVQPPKSGAIQPGGQSLAVIRGALGHDVARSLRDAGAPARIASDIAQAIALHPPLRNMPLDGSRFDVTYEAMPDASVGFILAEFTVNGVHQRIWRYRPEGGLPGFYTDDGTHIGGLTMQSPVPGAPIVSPYGMRKHPVLHVNKMHWGVDYEANTGTPILSAADGTIADARRLGNYGLYIRVSHSDGVETTYGHLSRFETGIHAGTPVKAGQVIGYAGSSGLASGPHLYFEVMVEGKRVDPRHMVSNEPLRLSGADLALFESLKQQAAAVQTASQRP